MYNLNDFDIELNKRQINNMKRAKVKMIYTYILIILVSLWIKIGLNINWHLNDVVMELSCLFTIIISGIIFNVKNDLPIFNLKNFEISKDFAYSITSFFSMMFIFIIYKNIVEPDFISYIAGLSFHDLMTLVVFLTPISIIILTLIYMSFKIIDNDFSNLKKIYSETLEENAIKFKSLTIKLVMIIVMLSFWLKIGLNNDFSFKNIITELLIVISSILIYVHYNKKSKLPTFYGIEKHINNRMITSIILPYFLVLVALILVPSFRRMLFLLNIRSLFSLLIYIAPLLFAISYLYYLGSKKNNIIKESIKDLSLKKNKTKLNGLLAFIITLVITLFVFLYFLNILNNNSIKNIIGVIIIIIPIFLSIFIILFNSIKEINN